jgi:ribonuclease P protein component
LGNATNTRGDKQILIREFVIIKYTFNHNEKLKSKKLIDLVFKQGNSFHSFPYRTIYLPYKVEMGIPEAVGFTKDFPVKFGISVSTRNFKKAVDRNKIKRMSREIWRLHKHLIYEKFLEKNIQIAVFYIYTQKEILPYDDLEKGILQGISKLIKLNSKEEING